MYFISLLGESDLRPLSFTLSKKAVMPSRHLFIFFLFFGLLSPHSTLPAQNQITMDQLWSEGTYSTNGVPGFRFMNDGRHYTTLKDNYILKYDFTTGHLTDTLLDINQVKLNGENKPVQGYEFSDNEKQLLLITEKEAIYRRSSKAQYFIYDLSNGKVSGLDDTDKQMHATFSPDGKKVAYVMANNLYIRDLVTGTTIQVTTDGKRNFIINGSCDWVYEEEFSFTKAFEWSPDARYIAYYKFDEGAVKEFTMTNYTGALYPEYETFKYPKVGMENAKVSIHLYDTEKKKQNTVDRTSEPNGYIPRIKWTNDASGLCVFWMNRHQNHLELLLAHPLTGETTLLMAEDNKYYIDIHDDLTFLDQGKGFIWTSEQDGYNHIYQYGMDGKIKKQITSGDWDVTAFYGYDKVHRLIYYQSATASPMERELFSIGIDGNNVQKLTNQKGANTAQFSTTFDYYVLHHSTINTAPVYAVFDRNGNLVRSLEDNHETGVLQKEAGVQPIAFFSFTTSEGVELNGYMIKPYNFDASKQYPVFMTQYGGPGSQKVLDQWIGNDYWWYQSLAQQGYIVACVDNRGTGGRGEEFKKMTYLQLGHYETMDQIEAAKYLGGLPYADARRIGIFGWSYGGYMSSLCLLKGNDVFNSAIAVAPVTNWKWYDTIYTERYMRNEKENTKGYEENSPVNFADRLKGNYLLVHGNSDDNVHFQHSAEMAAALIKANKQFETYYYPNRNHSIQGNNARRHLYVKMTDFLNQNLKPEHPVSFKNAPTKS